jgi:hypothetical protein
MQILFHFDLDDFLVFRNSLSQLLVVQLPVTVIDGLYLAISFWFRVHIC